jgi:hypothetical protein
MSSRSASRINRISSSSSSKSSRKTAKRKTVKKTNPSELTKHLKICSELYGVTYNYAKSNNDMQMLYYKKKNRDENGNILYPKMLQMIGRPMDKMLTRKPWTGEAIPNPDGHSVNAVLV